MFGFFKRAIARQSEREAKERKRDAERRRRAAATRSGDIEAPDFSDMVDGFQGFGVSAPPVDYTPIERHVASQEYDTSDYGRSCASDSAHSSSYDSSSSSSDSSSSCSSGD